MKFTTTKDSVIMTTNGGREETMIALIFLLETSKAMFDVDPQVTVDAVDAAQHLLDLNKEMVPPEGYEMFTKMMAVARTMATIRLKQEASNVSDSIQPDQRHREAGEGLPLV